MLARSAPTCPTFVLRSSSEPLSARPVDLPGVYSSVLFSRILNHSPLRALVGVLEFVAEEDVLPSEDVEASKYTRDPTRLRVHGVFPVGVLGRRPLALDPPFLFVLDSRANANIGTRHEYSSARAFENPARHPTARRPVGEGDYARAERLRVHYLERLPIARPRGGASRRPEQGGER
jgi:hypothetical protein